MDFQMHHVIVSKSPSTYLYVDRFVQIDFEKVEIRNVIA